MSQRVQGGVVDAHVFWGLVEVDLLGDEFIGHGDERKNYKKSGGGGI